MTAEYRSHPRLRSMDWKDRVEVLERSDYVALEQCPPSLLPRTIIWPATGPRRVDEQDLVKLRQEIRVAGTSAGYHYDREEGPGQATPDQKALLDLEVARTLHLRMRCSRNEASAPGVWMYIATMLAPELVRWRFLDRSGVSRARYGSHRLRNFFGRLWWRAELLYDSQAQDPYWLLAELGEDELVQITERTAASAYQPLAVGLGRTLLRVFRQDVHTNRGVVLREAMKRVVRWLPWACLEALDQYQLEEVLVGLFHDTLQGLGMPLQSPQQGLPLSSEAPHPSTAPTQQSTNPERLDTLIRLLPDAALADAVTLLGKCEDQSSERLDIALLASARPLVVVAPLSDEQADQILQVLENGKPGGGRRTLGAWLCGGPLDSDSLAALESLRSALNHPPPPGPCPHETEVDADAPDVSETEEDDDTGPTVRPDASDDSDLLDPMSIELPEPPPLALRIVELTGIQTVGEAMTLPETRLLALPGIGARKLEVFRDWVADLAGEYRSSGSHIAPPATPPLPAPPGLLRRVVADLDILTVPEALQIDPEGLRDLSGVGDAKVEAWSQWQDELRDAFPGVEVHVEPAPPAPPAPPEKPHTSSRALIEAMLNTLDERERDIVIVRYRHGHTLSRIGEQHGLSRERVRQLALRAIKQLRRRFGANAHELLKKEWCLGQLGPGLLHSSIHNRPTSPWSDTHLLAEVAGPDGWTPVDSNWLTLGSAHELRALCADVSQLGTNTLTLSANTIQEWLADHPTTPEPLLALILQTEFEYEKLVDGSWRRDPTTADRRHLLREYLLDAGGAVHQSIAAGWLAQIDGHQPDELDDTQKLSYLRRVEGMLERTTEALRFDMGSFIHRDNLWLSPQGEARAVAHALSRLEGATGPISTHVLVDELFMDGMVEPGLNHYVLKELLKRRPEVLILRKSLVAWAATFNEEGVQLGDRVEATLVEAAVPLTVEEVLEKLPPDIRYSPVSVRASLDNGGYAAHLGQGRYQLAQRD